jgi:hypothetical protein
MIAQMTIPRSNVLRWVRTDNYLSEPQNFDNRLLADEKWQTIETIHYKTQKFNAGSGTANTADPILIQFTTNISDFVCKMYDDSDNQVTITLTNVPYHPYLDGSGLVTYNILCDPSSIAIGLYRFKLTSASTGIEYTTEWIEIGLFSDLAYIQWQYSDRDGINYGEPQDISIIFGFRVEVYTPYNPNSESESYQGFNFQPELNFNAEKLAIDFKTIPQPRFISEKLKLACGHEAFYINGTQYSKNSDPKVTKIDLTNLYDFEVSLNMTEYEDYTLIQELSGVVILEGQLIDNEGSVLYDNFDEILFDVM